MGGGTRVISMPAPDNGPMLKMIANMETAQAQAREDAAKAQKEAISTAQDNAASAGANQGAYQAQQTLGMLNQYQKSQDAAASMALQQQAAAGGAAQVGGAYDINAQQAAQKANLNMASSALPKTDANISGMSKNPAMTTAKSANQFSMPNTSGLTFGGA